MLLNFIFQFIFALYLQAAAPTPATGGVKEWFEAVGAIVTPFAAIGLIVTVVYFFWHSKNREELTKAFAEASALADLRGKKIGDLEKTIAEKDIMLAAKDATILLKDGRIQEMELEDEKRARTEFRLRGEITELEKQINKKRA